MDFMGLNQLAVDNIVCTELDEGSEPEAEVELAVAVAVEDPPATST
jgi:hypothetical protein